MVDHACRNSLEGYLYSVKATVNERLRDDVDEAARSSCTEAVEKALHWLEVRSDEVEVGEMEERRRETAAVCDPVAARAYDRIRTGADGDGAGDGDAHDEL